MSKPKPIQRVQILYDGECPFCSRYAKLLRLREQVERLELLNAREHPGLVEQFRQRGQDVNTGMIAIVDGAAYHNDAAMVILAALSTPSDTFNRLNGCLFRSPLVAKVIYPPLKTGRRVVLFLIGRRLIP